MQLLTQPLKLQKTTGKVTELSSKAATGTKHVASEVVTGTKHFATEAATGTKIQRLRLQLALKPSS